MLKFIGLVTLVYLMIKFGVIQFVAAWMGYVFFWIAAL